MPVKDLAAAKQRLVPALAPDERRALAHAMLRDVLRALGAAGLDQVWVVTRDAEAAAAAERLGAEPLAPPTAAQNASHTAAVAFAQAEAGRRGARVFLTVPGDAPCVTAAEIRALATAAATRAPAFAPSRSGLGTNGVALAPPGLMPLRFGEPSFEAHLAAARACGLAPRVLRLPGLGLDVDTPDDLAVLLAEGGSTDSARLVERWRAAPLAPAPASRPRAPLSGHPRSEPASRPPFQ